ncbi:MAG: DUF2089 domain-containing protein [Tissierellia bacterium]|nr:DUF2089 domain-containing protein [Tissierellia bacterium]
MNKHLSKCPSCKSELVIKSYKCPACAIEVHGEFKQDKFSKLSTQQQDFIEIFIMKRGNLKEVEKVLGVSYPTVRNRLDEIITALGHTVDREEGQMEILALIDKGYITPEDGEQLLKEWRNSND